MLPLPCTCSGQFLVLQIDNVVVKTYGQRREEDGLRNHVDLVQMLDIVDLEAGTMVAGVHASRFSPTPSAHAIAVAFTSNQIKCSSLLLAAT